MRSFSISGFIPRAHWCAESSSRQWELQETARAHLAGDVHLEIVPDVVEDELAAEGQTDARGKKTGRELRGCRDADRRDLVGVSGGPIFLPHEIVVAQAARQLRGPGLFLEAGNLFAGFPGPLQGAVRGLMLAAKLIT